MEVLRYAAFTDDPRGGDPAGVVLDAAGLDDSRMLAVAAELGYSETAFRTPRGEGRVGVRDFSPLAEVPFCGHATIATGVAWAERHGDGDLDYEIEALQALMAERDSTQPAHGRRARRGRHRDLGDRQRGADQLSGRER